MVKKAYTLKPLSFLKVRQKQIEFLNVLLFSSRKGGMAGMYIQKKKKTKLKVVKGVTRSSFMDY